LINGWDGPHLGGHFFRDSRGECEAQVDMACGLLYLQGIDFKIDDDSYDGRKQTKFGFDKPNDQ
jgi:hypothetical protein